MILVIIERIHAAILAIQHFLPLAVECESFVVNTSIVFLRFNYAICLFKLLGNDTTIKRI